MMDSIRLLFHFFEGRRAYSCVLPRFWAGLSIGFLFCALDTLQSVSFGMEMCGLFGRQGSNDGIVCSSTGCNIRLCWSALVVCLFLLLQETTLITYIPLTNGLGSERKRERERDEWKSMEVVVTG